MVWTPFAGEICTHARTHHPALKPLAGPVRLVRIIESGSCWVQPLNPACSAALARSQGGLFAEPAG